MKHKNTIIVALVCMVLIVIALLIAAIPAKAAHECDSPVKPDKWCEECPLDADLQKALLRICRETGVDKHLALGLIETESGFNTDIVSQSGDYGLCQLNKLYFDSPNMTPEENMAAGMGLLSSNIKRYNGNISAALTAYNRGYDDGSRSYSAAVLWNARKWGYAA